MSRRGIGYALKRLGISRKKTFSHPKADVAAQEHFKEQIKAIGTGYSSLSYLKRFPIDKLKIDQSFVRDVPNNKEDMSIIKAIIALARSLRLSVIAEGVETKSQKIFLKSLKCDEIQGYLVGRPMPEQDFIKLLMSKA